MSHLQLHLRTPWPSTQPPHIDYLPIPSFHTFARTTRVPRNQNRTLSRLRAYLNFFTLKLAYKFFAISISLLCEFLYQTGSRQNRTNCDLPCPFWKSSRTKVPRTPRTPVAKPRPVRSIPPSHQANDAFIDPNPSSLTKSKKNNPFNISDAYFSTLTPVLTNTYCTFLTLPRLKLALFQHFSSTFTTLIALGNRNTNHYLLGVLGVLGGFILSVLRVLSASALSNPSLILSTCANPSLHTHDLLLTLQNFSAIMEQMFMVEERDG